MERRPQHVHGLRQEGRAARLRIIGACLLGLLTVGGPAMSRAAEPVSVPRPAGQSAPQPQQERFLQNFISQSLGQNTASTTAPDVPPPATPQSAVLSPPSSVPGPPSVQPAGDLTAAAMKMVLSLGGILALLVLGGYVMRRYLLDQTFLGKRTPLIRVLGRVNITPKAGVALLEVPGKVLVVGITGSTLVALGEIASLTAPPLEHATPAPAASFATALDDSTRVHSTDSLPGEDRPADVLLKISEAIQQKVSRLKQL